MDKKFKLTELFYSLKLLGKYDVKSGKFDRSFKFYVQSYLFLLANCIFIPNFIFFYLTIDNEDEITTILIGDIYFKFNPIAKFFLAILVVLANLWVFSIHQTYLYVHNRKENLLIYCLKLIYEIEPEIKNEYDEKFFKQASKLNYKLDLFLNWSSVISSIFVSMPYILLGIKLNIFILYLAMFFHYIFLLILILNAVKITCTFNLIIVSLFIYFIKKFEILSNQISDLENVNNLELSKLISNFKILNQNIRLSNLYFNFLFGFNFLFSFSCSIFMNFLFFSVNQFFTIPMSFTLAFLVTADIFIPYCLSSCIQKKTQKSKNQFRKFLFKPNIDLNLKIAIKSLIEDDQACFKCFSLFELSAFHAYQITVNAAMNILLLIKIYYI